MAKKHYLSEKYFRMSIAGATAVAVERKICATPTAQTIRPRKPHLGQLDVLHTQNLEIQVPKGSHLREVF
jgi:hypothetical protein